MKILIQKKPNLKAQEKLDLKLSILDFVYFLRDKHLGDDEFENVNLKDLLDNNFLLNGFKNFKKKISRSLFNIDKIFHSTSHLH